ncbi:hypothetical protein MN0502_11010 [Arthrobacter sp. MN05-02]|nr:hypothetical protein MN0502_11010 [Arthrobacter sp. MN05-02]
MGNEYGDANHRVHNDVIEIIDIGASAADEPIPSTSNKPGLTRRKQFALGGTLMACVFAGLTLLPSTNDGPPAEPVETPAEALNACEAIEQSEKQEAAELAGQSKEPQASEHPPGYSLFGVMTSNDSTSLIGLTHPDGFIQICEQSARSAPFDVRFPTEADLGELPDGMTYAYASSSSFTDNTLTLRLEGVRRADGTVTKSVTLPDGKTVPATVESNT